MKKIISRLSVILLTLLFVVSCEPEWEFGQNPHKLSRYILFFEFMDPDGNPLGKDMELCHWTPSNSPREKATHGMLSRDVFNCDIILSQPNEGTYPDGRVRVNDGGIQFAWRYYNQKQPVECWMGYDLALNWELIEPQEILTYEITCPDIFGDGEKHVFTTYWQEHGYTIDKTENRFPRCYRVEYDGKDYDVTQGRIEQSVIIQL